MGVREYLDFPLCDVSHCSSLVQCFWEGSHLTENLVIIRSNWKNMFVLWLCSAPMVNYIGSAWRKFKSCSLPHTKFVGWIKQIWSLSPCSFMPRIKQHKHRSMSLNGFRKKCSASRWVKSVIQFLSKSTGSYCQVWPSSLCVSVRCIDKDQILSQKFYRMWSCGKQHWPDEKDSTSSHNRNLAKHSSVALGYLDQSWPWPADFEMRWVIPCFYLNCRTTPKLTSLALKLRRSNTSVVFMTKPLQNNQTQSITAITLCRLHCWERIIEVHATVLIDWQVVLRERENELQSAQEQMEEYRSCENTDKAQKSGDGANFGSLSSIRTDDYRVSFEGMREGSLSDMQVWIWLKTFNVQCQTCSFCPIPFTYNLSAVVASLSGGSSNANESQKTGFGTIFSAFRSVWLWLDFSYASWYCPAFCTHDFGPWISGRIVSNLCCSSNNTV